FFLYKKKWFFYLDTTRHQDRLKALFAVEGNLYQVFVYFPTSCTFFPDNIKQFQYPSGYILFFYLFFQKPLHEIERYIVFQLHTCIRNIVELLSDKHFLLQRLLKYAPERLKINRNICDLRRYRPPSAVIDVVKQFQHMFTFLLSLSGKELR